MCDICMQNPCPSACPNAIDRVVGLCAVCKEPIYESEDGLIVDGETYHIDCLEELDIIDLLELLEHTAERITEEG